MIVEPQGRRCGCGRIGCWETVSGLRAILDLAADPDDPVRDPVLGIDDRLAELNRRASLGDTRTLAALDQVGAWVGVGAAMLANALNPATIVLSGYFAAVGEHMRPAIETRLQAGVLAPDAGGTRVELSTLGFTAAVRGGAQLCTGRRLRRPRPGSRAAPSPKESSGDRDPDEPTVHRLERDRTAPDDRHRQGVPRCPRARRRGPRCPRRRGALPPRPERRRQVHADQGALGLPPARRGHHHLER